MKMATNTKYLYFHIRIEGDAETPLIHDLQLDEPLIMTVNSTVSISQIYFVPKDKRRRALIAMLYMTGASMSDIVIKNKLNPPIPNYACIIPSPFIVHKNIDILPFTSGVYNGFKVSIRDFQGNLVPFSEMVLSIKVSA